VTHENQASNVRTPHPEANADSARPMRVVADNGWPACTSKVEDPAVSSQPKEFRGSPPGQDEEQAPLGLLTHENFWYPPGITPRQAGITPTGPGLGRHRQRRDRQPRQQEQAQVRQPVMPHPSGLVFFGQPG